MNFPPLFKTTTATSVATSNSSSSSSSSIPIIDDYVELKEQKVPITLGNTPYGGSSAMAVAGVSEFSGPDISFSQGSMRDRFRVNVRIPFCTVGVPPSGSSSMTSSSSFPALQINSYAPLITDQNVRDTKEMILISPTLNLGLRSIASGGIWANPSRSDCNIGEILSLPFSKCELVEEEIEVDYSPQSSTADDTAFAFCFANDPMHPLNGAGIFAEPDMKTAPTYSSTKNSCNSVVFSCWCPWKMKFKVEKGQRYYTTSGFLNSFDWSTMDAAFTRSALNLDSWSPDIRDSFFGVVSCYANKQSSTSSFLPKGQLYINYRFEFSDLVPILSDLPLPYALANSLDMISKSRRVAPFARKRGSPNDDSASPFYRSSSSTSRLLTKGGSKKPNVANQKKGEKRRHR